MFPAAGGEEVDVTRLAEEIVSAPVEGLSLLGGEPFEQEGACAELAAAVRAAGRSVMVFTGFRLEELDPTSPLLAATDVLVDGRYERDHPETARRWVGSRNQRVHFLSDRYGPQHPDFAERNEVVIRLSRDGLSVHGWPPAAAKVRRP
jgi:anaerobic ribonucleoside-triphosphate reductase activating protein